MKVFIIGKQNMLHWVEHISEAFESTEGVEVFIFKVNNLGVSSDLIKNIKKLFSKENAYKFIRDTIVKEIRSFQPDLILTISPFLLDEMILEALEEVSAGIIKAAWIGDRIAQAHMKSASYFDILFATDTGFIEEAKRLGFPPMFYLPLAVNERIFYERNLQRAHELLFIGAPTRQRIEIINQIEAIPVRVIGKDWKKVISKNVIGVDRNIGIDAVSEAYNRSEFVLNIKHEHNVINGLNMRSFEAPGCGACLVQDNVRDLELNFDLNEEVLVYSSIDELNEKLAVLHTDKVRFDIIRNNGKRRVMAEHTYRHRVNSILKIIS